MLKLFILLWTLVSLGGQPQQTSDYGLLKDGIPSTPPPVGEGGAGWDPDGTTVPTVPPTTDGGAGWDPDGHK